LKQIGMAGLMYVGDYDDTYAWVGRWGRLWVLDADCQETGYTNRPGFYMPQAYEPYIKNVDVLYCPSKDKKDPIDFGTWTQCKYQDNQTSYFYEYWVWGWFWSKIDKDWKWFDVQVAGSSTGIIPKPAEFPMHWDLPYWGWSPDYTKYGVHTLGMNVGYADGHAKYHRHKDYEDFYYDFGADGLE
jgi:prepilin-type processing-associated H-X9-DG protein